MVYNRFMNELQELVKRALKKNDEVEVLEPNENVKTDINDFLLPEEICWKFNIKPLDFKQCCFLREGEVWETIKDEVKKLEIGLAKQLIKYPFRVKAISEIRKIWFPETYAVITYEDTTEKKKKRIEYEKNIKNISGFKI